MSAVPSGAAKILPCGGWSRNARNYISASYTERVISIEDTRELQPPQPNWLSLLASKGDQGTSKVTIQDLLESSLRLLPDRLFLGEIRGRKPRPFCRRSTRAIPVR